MIALEADGLAAIVDPDHGGEVLDLIGPGGARPLGRPPFAPLPPQEGDLDEDAWTDRYRGGWQLVAPNAGNACIVGDEHHGFHGRASTVRWAVLDRGSSFVVLAAVVHGLRFERRLELAAGSLRADTTVAALDRATPLVALEHVACGASVLDPSCRLDVPAGRAYELDEATGPVAPPPNAPRFPRALLRNGTMDDASLWPVAAPGARLLVIAELPEGQARVANTATGEGLALRWDHAVLPHLWIWQEIRASGGRWRGQAELLGIEPSMVPHTLGLERAVDAGQARIVSPGEPLEWWIEVTPIPAGAVGGGSP